MITTTLRRFLSGEHWTVERQGGGCTIYRSFTLQGGWSLPKLEGFVEVEKWEDAPYRRVWVSDEDLAIATYCEGDITVQVFAREISYSLALQYASEFYARH